MTARDLCGVPREGGTDRRDNQLALTIQDVRQRVSKEEHSISCGSHSSNGAIRKVFIWGVFGCGHSNLAPLKRL